MNNSKDKNLFYDQLQSVVKRFSEKDVSIAMKGFNAKIGSVNLGYEKFMGIRDYE